MIEFILKRYKLYANKNELLFDNMKNDELNGFSENYKNKTNTEIDKNMNNAVENSKKIIQSLKNRLIEEETNLMNLYKLKN